MQPEPIQVPAEYGPPITLELAKRVMASAEAEAASNHWTVVIVIVDSGGNLVMLHKQDQTPLGSIAIAQSKAETAVNFKCATKVREEALASGGLELRLLTIRNLIALEGGIPLILDDKIIGAIGVSGMHPSQDSQVAIAGSNSLTG
jgi:glc operon protein GlcG